MRDPHGEHLLVLCGWRGGLIKVLGKTRGMCLFAKRLELDASSGPLPAEWYGDDHAGAARLSDGRDRLAP
jgi:hypothetical protein